MTIRYAIQILDLRTNDMIQIEAPSNDERAALKLYALLASEQQALTAGGANSICMKLRKISRSGEAFTILSDRFENGVQS